MNQAGVSYLLKAQDSIGGWGYFSALSPSVEPTAAAILALQGINDAKPAVERAADWLTTAQHADGGWGLNAEDTLSGWQTSWAVLALAHVGKAEKQVQQAIDWLAAMEVYRVTDNEVLQAFNQAIGVDFSLHGWPWGQGEASWVQPTAMALLALRGSTLSAAPQARVDEALRYLDNRRVPGGGWNVGNPAMFDGVLPAHVIPTSLVLLVFQQYAVELILQEDWRVLLQEMEFDGGAKALAYGLLALKGSGQDPSELRRKLEALQQENGGWEEDSFATALALLALEGSL